MKSILLATALFVSQFAALSASAAIYKLDPGHLEVGFSVRHMMISNVKGHFDKVTGSFDYDAAKKTLKNVEVTIETASITTSQADRDKHLTGPDFFDVAKYPKMTFKSEKIEFDGKKGKMTGPLTIKDKTKNVTLDFTYNGETEIMGTKKVGFSAHGTINRKDWGMTWNKNMDHGGVAVGDEVTLNIEGEGNAEGAPAPAKK